MSKDPRLSKGSTAITVRIPQDDYETLIELRETKKINSINDGLLQALDYWFVHKHGYAPHSNTEESTR